MATRPMNKLRTKLFEAGIIQTDLGKIFGRSQQYICDRMKAVYAFDIWEVYALCDLLEIDYSEIPKYFPYKDVTVNKEWLYEKKFED